MQEVDRKKALSMTAQALAQRYGIKIVFRGNEIHTVYDDQYRPVEIYLPEIPKREFTDEILRLLRGAIDHEAAHVRFTNMADVDKFLLKQTNGIKVNRVNTYTRLLFNALEDVYVEGKMMQIYQGCKTNFINLAEDLIGDTKSFEDAYSTQFTPNDFLYSIAQFVSVYTRCKQFPQSATLSNALSFIKQYIKKLNITQDQDNLVDAIQREIDDRLPQITCTQDNLDLAESIYDLIQQWTDDNLPPPPSQSDEQQSDEQQSDEQQSDEQQSDGQQSDGQQSDGQQSDGQQSDGQQSDEQQSDGQQSDEQQSDGQQSDGQTKENIKNILDSQISLNDSVSVGESANRKLSALQQSSNQNWNSVGYSPEDESYSSKETILRKMDDETELEARAISSQLDSQLTGLLQHYVQNYGGAASCGRHIDMHKLHRLSSGRVDIFKRRVEKHGINTEVVFVVDYSGSMDGDREKIASQSVYAAMRSLRKIKDVRSHAVMFNSRCAIMYEPDHQLEPYRMIACGGTIVGHGIIYAKTKLDLSKDMRRILILITDGETVLPEETKDVVDETLEQGIEIYGIGIQTDRSCLDPYLSESRYRLIQDLREFPSVLFSVLREGLLNHRGPRG